MLELVGRGLTTRTDVNVLDRASITRLAASISGIVFLVIGYVWSRPTPPEELEQELTENLTSSSLLENDAELSYIAIDSEESDSVVDRLSPSPALDRQGRVTATVKLRGEDVKRGFDFDRVRFAALCNQTGVDADYEVLDVHPGRNSAVVEVTVESLRTDRVCYFLTTLEHLRLAGADARRTGESHL